MNGRPILTLVLAPGRPVPKPSSTGFPLSFGTGSNGMRNMNQGMRGMPQPPPRCEPSMEATLGPYTQSVVSALGIGPAWAAPTVPGSMASGKDPHDTTFSRIHTPTGLISTRERVIEPKNEINNRPILTPVLAPGRPVPKPSSTGFPLSFGTGSNGMRNMNQGMRGVPQPPPRREPSMEATLGPSAGFNRA